MNISNLKAFGRWVIHTLWTACIVLGLIGVTVWYLSPFYEAHQTELSQELAQLQASVLTLTTNQTENTASLATQSTLIKSLSSQGDGQQRDIATINTNSVSTQNKLSDFQLQLINHTQQIAKLTLLAKNVPKVIRAAPKAIPPKPKKSPVQTKVIVPSPFELLDIQFRGATLLAVVAPNNAKTLQEVALTRQGEAFLGWKIIKIHAASVDIKKGGDVLTLEVAS